MNTNVSGVGGVLEEPSPGDGAEEAWSPRIQKCCWFEGQKAVGLAMLCCSCRHRRCRHISHCFCRLAEAGISSTQRVGRLCAERRL